METIGGMEHRSEAPTNSNYNRESFNNSCEEMPYFSQVISGGGAIFRFSTVTLSSLTNSETSFLNNRSFLQSNFSCSMI